MLLKIFQYVKNLNFQEQSLLEATVQYKQTHFIPIKQHLELETTLLALKAGSTDSLSQDSGKTGSLDDGILYLISVNPYPKF